jgi:Sensors of blue-light using FAD
VLSIVYSSSASDTFTEADLPALLAQSRDNNARLGITGMLLYRDGRFLQLLEGEKDVVRAKLEVIAGDDRHVRIRRLIEDDIGTRQFPDWSMGYGAALPGDVGAVPGYRTTFDDIVAAENEPGSPVAAIRELIRWFQTEPSRLL